jgi:RNA polymerase sigma-70 factor, ECF subfamily
MDEPAVASAYREYGGAVFARCARILRDDEVARDVTQEVFVRCFDRRTQLRPGRELLAWLYRVATNLCLNAIRDARFRRKADGSVASPPVVDADGASQRGVLDLLAGLDERTQAIAVYVYLDGMTHTEAAEVAAVSDRTVRNCLTRFLEHGRSVVGDDDGPYLPALPKVKEGRG